MSAAGRRRREPPHRAVAGGRSSSRSTSNLGSLRGELARHECGRVLNRIEILGQQFPVGNGNPEPLLEERHQFEDPGRVDDAVLEE